MVRTFIKLKKHETFFFNQRVFLGQRQEVSGALTQLTLAQFLRDNLGLSGTKIACGESGCGSCTVLIWRNGSNFAINSCNVKLWTLHGSSIRTIEGVGSPKTKLHPAQKILGQNHGVQCGFCSPGMVMSMLGNPADIEDVAKCLQGNLCRCTGYRPILEGFQSLSKEDLNLSSLLETLDSVGPFQDFNHQCFVPTNLDEVLDLMKTFHGKGWKFVQGGTGSYQMESKSSQMARIGLHLVPELRNHSILEHEVRLGSGLKLTEVKQLLQNVPWCSAFVKALETLASPQVRNQATIGGAVFWTHPASDLWPLFAVYDCKFRFIQADKKNFVVGFKNSKIWPNDVLISEIIIPKPDSGYEVNFIKKSRRKEFDLAILNMASSVLMDQDIIKDVKIVFGGLDSFSHFAGSPKKVKFAENVMKFLIGKNVIQVTSKDLRSAIESDLELGKDALFPSLKLKTAESFIKSLFNKTDEVEKTKMKSCQVYQKVSSSQPSHDLVHRPIPHLWADELASGTATFVDDMTKLAHECQIVLIRSQKAHAKITKLDLTQALKCEGIVGALTAQDLPGDRNLWGLFLSDETVFASDKVEYHGQLMGALVCQSKEQGQQALGKVVVEYEELPFVLNLKHAREILKRDLNDMEICGMEASFERTQNNSTSKENVKGNSQNTIVENEFVQPPKNLCNLELSGTMRLGGAEHFYMEPHSVIAVPGEKDELVVYHSTQEVANTQKRIAVTCGLPMHKVLVKNKRAGGGFGGKERMHEALVASLAAHKFKRPTRLIFSRAEDFELTGQRHESIVDYKVWINAVTGKILAVDFQAYANAGCSTDLSFFWVMILLMRLDGGYTLENFQGKARAIKTNSPSNTAFRGFGGPEGAFYIETIMDRIAYELQLPQLQVREVNLSKENDLLHHSESRLKACTLQDCWKVCLERSKYTFKAEQVALFNQTHKDIKRGLSIVPIKFFPGMGAKEAMKGSALVRVYEDGSVLLTHGGIEMGQGLHTKMVQIASRALAIDPDLIHINEVSTETLANTSPTGGSCGTDLNGPAVLDACEKIRHILEPYRQKCPQKAWVDWVQMALSDRACLTQVGHYDQSPLNYNPVMQKGDAFAYLTYGVCAVQVQVHCLTGEVTILSADLVMDLGKSLNPGIDIGQIEGAFMMGLGIVTTEQLLRDVTTGNLVTNGPSHYKIPTVADIPKEFNVTLLAHDPETEVAQSAIYSSKGVGEPPICASAAIILAIKEAIMSYRKDQGNLDWFCLEPPCTPEKIVKMASTNEDVIEPFSYIEM